MSDAAAAQGAVGFRSGFTEGNGIPPRGKMDVDYGSSVANIGGARSYTAGEVVAHVPLSRRFGLRLHLNSYAWVNTGTTQFSGREDMGVGAAFALRASNGWRPAAALLTRVDLPNGSLSRRGPVSRPTLKAALAWRLPMGVAMASNIGLASLYAADDHYTQRFGSLWLGRQITRRVGGFTEVFAFDREAPSGPSTRYARAGITVLVTNAIHLDVNASTQLGGASPRRTLGLGAKHRM
jgi:Putative MetA-pathway of phenol degradation